MSKIIDRFRDLQEGFHPTTLDFAFSRGYIEQATRNGLYVRGEWDSSVIFTKRNQNDGGYVIVTAAGRNVEYAIAKTASELARYSKKDVIIKNANLEWKIGEDYRDNESWDSHTKYDDNTFPQQVLSVKEVLKLEGSKYGSLRRELARFDRDYELEVRPYRDVDAFNELLDNWAKQLNERSGCDIEEARRAHLMYMAPNNPGYYQFEVVDVKKDKIIGMINFSEISQRALAHNMIVIDDSYRDLYRKLVYEGCKIADGLGFEYLNLQGSETEGQHKSKRRFRASIEISKKHRVWRWK